LIDLNSCYIILCFKIGEMDSNNSSGGLVDNNAIEIKEVAERREHQFGPSRESSTNNKNQDEEVEENLNETESLNFHRGEDEDSYQNDQENSDDDNEEFFFYSEEKAFSNGRAKHIVDSGGNVAA